LEPRFSVIIPSYNRAATLCRAIESVLHQTYPAFEIIVVDDGSSDQSRQVVEKYPTVSYCYQENQGVSAARNRGAELATGVWLIFLDSDDELLPSALLDFSNSIKDKPTGSIVLAGYFLKKNGLETTYVPEPGKYIGHLSGSFAIRRQVFEQVGGYDAELKFAENTELFFRLDRKELERIEIPNPVLRYHQDSGEGYNNLGAMSDSILYILEKHLDLDKHIRRLYHQILGVNYLRFRQFSLARKHLFRAYLLNPFKLDTLVRLGIALVPSLAKQLYSPNPQHK
jgi:glycosyltransferase involved in cell wall biosynthesis